MAVASHTVQQGSLYFISSVQNSLQQHTQRTCAAVLAICSLPCNCWCFAKNGNDATSSRAAVRAVTHIGPFALALHGKSDRLDFLGGLVGVEAGEGVPVPAAHPREVDPVVLQWLLYNCLQHTQRPGLLNRDSSTRPDLQIHSKQEGHALIAV